MKAWQQYACAMSALLLGMNIGVLHAQTPQTIRPGQTAGPKFLVPVIHSKDKLLGEQAGNAIRERMQGDFMGNQLWIVPKTDIENSLDASGYPKTEALTTNDLRVLAPTVHAEEYLDGTIERSTDGTLTLKSTMSLVRPPGMTQPLPDVSDAKIAGIAKLVSGEIDKARKQIPATRQCLQFAQQRKFDEAMAAAQKGITAYPKAVLARVCMLEVANLAKMGPDSIIKIGEQILTIYPENGRALQLLADAYGEKKMDDKYVETMMKMLHADPTNASLLETVIDVLGRSGKPEVAKPLIDEWVKQNPGDPTMIKKQWQIYRAMKLWKDAALIGEEMVKADTALADTLFFKQLIGSYVADSQAQKAAETAARATAKFPKNPGLWLTYAQLARQSGQAPQALMAINKVMEINPKYPQAAIMKVTILKEMNQSDSVLAAIRAAVAAGEDKVAMGTLALQAASAVYQSFARDSTKTLEHGEHVLALLAWADSLNPAPTASLLMGATKLNIALIHLQKASETKSCDSAKAAKDALNDASIQIPKGGRTNPQLAGQLMQGVMQLQGTADQYVKSFKCK